MNVTREVFISIVLSSKVYTRCHSGSDWAVRVSGQRQKRITNNPTRISLLSKAFHTISFKARDQGMKTAPSNKGAVRFISTTGIRKNHSDDLKRFRTAPTAPSKPVPRRTMLAGSGTALVVICPWTVVIPLFDAGGTRFSGLLVMA